MAERVFSLNTVFNFGKYAGYTLEEVFDLNLKYIHWCLNEQIFILDEETKEFFEKRTKLYREIEANIIKNFTAKDFLPNKRTK